MQDTLDSQINSLYELLKFIGVPPKSFDKLFRAVNKYKEIRALRDIEPKGRFDVLSEIITIMENDPIE